MLPGNLGFTTRPLGTCRDQLPLLSRLPLPWGHCARQAGPCSRRGDGECEMETRGNCPADKHVCGHGLLHPMAESLKLHVLCPPNMHLKSQSFSNDSKSMQYIHVRTHTHTHTQAPSKKEVMEDSSFLKVTELMPIKGQLVHFSTSGLLLTN